jgi:hypothetical protein
MEQHPIPRQITTFEFKLIGFMTVKQFIYLIIFIPLGLIVFYLFPIPILNFILAALPIGLGFALAFLPVYDRPLDFWVVNFYKRLTSPTQYFYKKNNPPIYFLTDISLKTEPNVSLNYLQSQNYLNKYLQKTTTTPRLSDKKGKISQLFFIPFKKNKEEEKKTTPSLVDKQKNQAIDLTQKKMPFLTGLIKNHKLIPLSGLLVYIKNKNGEVLRILKTNPHGIFATFNPLPEDEYIFEIKDPKNTYLFDTMKIKINKQNNKPLEFYSREIL